MRQDISFEAQEHSSGKEIGELMNLLPFMKQSKYGPVRTLAQLQAKQDRLLETKRMQSLNHCLNTLKIRPERFTRKKNTNIKKLVNQIIGKHPILRYISLPYYFNWHHTKDHEEEKTDLNKILYNLIK